MHWGKSETVRPETRRNFRIRSMKTNPNLFHCPSRSRVDGHRPFPFPPRACRPNSPIRIDLWLEEMKLPLQENTQ